MVSLPTPVTVSLPTGVVSVRVLLLPLPSVKPRSVVATTPANVSGMGVTFSIAALPYAAPAITSGPVTVFAAGLATAKPAPAIIKVALAAATSPPIRTMTFRMVPPPFRRFALVGSRSQASVTRAAHGESTQGNQSQEHQSQEHQSRGIKRPWRAA